MGVGRSTVEGQSIGSLLATLARPSAVVLLHTSPSMYYQNLFQASIATPLDAKYQQTQRKSLIYTLDNIHGSVSLILAFSI